MVIAGFPFLSIAEEPEQVYGYAKKHFDAGDYFTTISQLEYIYKVNKNAGFLLATIYENGLGVRKSMTTAIKYLNIAAELGHKEASYRLSELNELDSSGQSWTKRVADKGSPKHIYIMGLNASPKSSGMELLKQSAGAGYLPAQKELAKRYLDGVGVIQNYTKSLAWYKKAASLGDDESQVMMGNAYYHGFPIEKNLNSAMYWYKKSACDNLNLDSVYNMAMVSDKNGKPVVGYSWILIAHKTFNDSTEPYDRALFNKFAKLSSLIANKLSRHEILKSQVHAPNLCK